MGKAIRPVLERWGPYISEPADHDLAIAVFEHFGADINCDADTYTAYFDDGEKALADFRAIDVVSLTDELLRDEAITDILRDGYATAMDLSILLDNLCLTVPAWHRWLTPGKTLTLRGDLE